MVVGIDIGTTKVCVVICERNERDILEVTGVGLQPSKGIKKGVVTNIESTFHAIAAAVEEAELMCGREIRTCWAGIGGSHIDGINSRGVVTVSGKNREIREIGPDDKSRALQLAKEVNIPMDRQLLEVIPQTYIVDSQKGIRDPLDMLGVRLEVEVYIITSSLTSGQNLIKCVNRAGFHVEELILRSLAAGRAVLTEEEKDMGVALLDLGAGTTELLAYTNGVPCATGSIPAGAELISRDISLMKGISFDNAEKLKLEAGCCWEDFLEGDDVIISGLGGRSTVAISRGEILHIIRPRVEEIFRLAKEKLEKLGKLTPPSPLGAGIVLTGGGAMLPGAVELAAHIFKMPVRMGNPLPVPGLAEEYRNPLYATAIGLALEGNDREQDGKEERGGEILVTRKGGSRWGIGKIVDWLREFF
jgi:cell division protein FtsA